MELTVKIGSVIFLNRETGFYIFKAHEANNGEQITAKGVFPGISLNTGLKVKLEGKYEDHPTYGKQFAVSACEILPEKGKVGIITYLSSHVKSVGPITASRLYDVFGDDLVHILENDPEQIFKVSFLNKNQSKAIVEEWKMSSEMRTAAIFLTDLGLNSSQIKSVYKHFERSTQNIVKENPYRLYECPGVGFQTADIAARKLGIGVDDLRRVRAMILFILTELSRSEGHMFCTSDQIRAHAHGLFRYHSIEPFSHGEYISDSSLYSILSDLEKEGSIIYYNNWIYLVYNWKYESRSAKCLAKIISQKSCSLGNLESILGNFEKVMGLTLSEEQRKAFLTLEKSRICVISGYPGTGKTLLISALVHLFEKNNLHYSLLSPTGIAAKRLSQVTQRPASTIHRALGYKRDGTWEFDNSNKYYVDAIIVDEMCLPYRQFVNLADGTKRCIGTIVNGKEPVEILSYNHETREIEPKKVTNWFKYKRRHDLYKIIVSKMSPNRSRILRCTGNHRVYIEGGLQKKASDLSIGDRVIVHGPPRDDINSYEIQSISTYTPNDQHSSYLYDIEVEDNHNYFSDGILISNSMVDGSTFYHLVTAIQNTTIVVLVGDSAQLPSVGAGYVLNNLIRSDFIPHISLTQIYRQEEQSDIIEVAHSILAGRSVNTTFNSESEFVFLSFDEDDILNEICKLTAIMKRKKTNFQVIAPIYNGNLGVDNLNLKLREVLNLEFVSGRAAKLKHDVCDLYEGDRVMIIKNDYDRMIFNGDVGKIQRISIRDNKVEVRVFGWFDHESQIPRYIDKVFTFSIEEARFLLKVAFACTAHKVQGQEFDFVLLPMTISYRHMLYRNLLYTAITRARKKVFVFGDPKAFSYAISNDRETIRNSALINLINENMLNQHAS